METSSKFAHLTFPNIFNLRGLFSKLADLRKTLHPYGLSDLISLVL